MADDNNPPAWVSDLINDLIKNQNEQNTKIDELIREFDKFEKRFDKFQTNFDDMWTTSIEPLLNYIIASTAASLYTEMEASE